MRRAPAIGLALTVLLGGCASPATHTGPGPTDASLTPADASTPDAGTAAVATDGSTGGPHLPSTSSLFNLIDDMDHTDHSLSIGPLPSSFSWRRGASVSFGNWFVSSQDGLQDVGSDDILPPRGDSKMARHVSGNQFGLGTDLWAQLDHAFNRPVDLSAYAGIAFWARLNSPSGRLIVAFNARRPDTFFGADANKSPWPWLARGLAGSEWERVVLLFDDFGRALDTSAVASIDFVVGGGGEPFDLWIDDLMLLCRGVCQE